VARELGKHFASGLNVSPGTALGVVALDVDLAETWAKQEGKKVIMVRPETKPDDVHGKLETTIPDIKDPWLEKFLSWADEYRLLGVWANADYPVDARRARDYGAEGIGLSRSEHMFFESERLPHVQKMIMTDLPIERKEALDAVLPFQSRYPVPP
jgi:pyruvate, orthophosphate dikinase